MLLLIKMKGDNRMNLITVQGRHCGHKIDTDEYPGIKFDTKVVSDADLPITRLPVSISNDHCKTRRPARGEARKFFSDLRNTP